MAKIKLLSNEDETHTSAFFQCPACDRWHPFRVKDCDPSSSIWDWNGDLERPTFSPSLLVYPSPGGQVRCHSFVIDGRIQFCGDCEHSLAGQTVDLPDIDDS